MDGCIYDNISEVLGRVWPPGDGGDKKEWCEFLSLFFFFKSTIHYMLNGKLWQLHMVIT